MAWFLHLMECVLRRTRTRRNAGGESATGFIQVQGDMAMKKFLLSLVALVALAGAVTPAQAQHHHHRHCFHRHHHRICR